MIGPQDKKGRLLFVAESVIARCCADLLEALHREGVDVSTSCHPELLVRLVNAGVSLIVILGDGNRMFWNQICELEVAECETPVIYLYTQVPGNTRKWPECVTFWPWTCEKNLATLEAVLQQARQKCRTLTQTSVAIM